MKKCFKCERELPLSEFYKHKQMKDGHLNKCRSCTKKDSTEHRNKNIEEIRKYDRGRGNRQTKEYLGGRREKYKTQYVAQTMIGNAIRDGRLFRECCGECGVKFAHAHHDDYAKPLNVRWLCAACHSQWHRDNGEGKNRE